MKNKINISKMVSDKVKHLHRDKLYTYSVFENIPDKNRGAFRKAMSHIAKDGVIVKLSRGKFYKRGYRKEEVPKNIIRIKAMKENRKALRRKTIPAKLLRSILSSNLFWSNPTGNIPIDNVISALIKAEAISDLDFVRFNYGDNRVIEVFLKNFKVNDNPMIRNILHV